MSDKKITSYLLYALGEILLVVIGILIALAINNANLDRKDREIALVHLNSLHEEFKYNLALLDSTIKLAEGLAEGARLMTKLFDPKTLEASSEVDVSASFGRLNNEAVYSPSNGALLEIISSGNLKLLNNPKLKQHLASFEKLVLRVGIQEQEALKLRSEMSVFMRQQGSVTALLGLDTNSAFENTYKRKPSNKSLFKSAYFQNTVVFYNRVQQAAVDSHYQPLRSVIEEIVALLDEEITERS